VLLHLWVASTLQQPAVIAVIAAQHIICFKAT
jgi:hypothetical protein